MNRTNGSGVISTIEKSTEEQINNTKVSFLSLFILTSLLHLLVQYIIQKKRLNDNQYYLIRVLSLADSFVLATSCILAFQFTNSKNGLVFISLLLYIGFSYSTLVTLIIAVDRWVAVKWCLRYYTLFSRFRINGVLGISGAINAVNLSFLFYMYEVWSMRTFYTNDYVMIYITSIRAVSCLLLIVLKKQFGE